MGRGCHSHKWKQRRMLAALLSCAAGAAAGVPEPAPCDIFEASGTPCVAAHSVVRALYAAYSGPLYQIVRTSDGASINISTLNPGGYAASATQTSFCSDSDNDYSTVRTAQQLAPWLPGPCCGRKACPDRCDRRSPGACPTDPGCVGCAQCGTPSRAPNLSTCMITRIFDQSGKGNHVHVIGEPSGLKPVGTGGRIYRGGQITGTNASADPLIVNGHTVYSAYFEGGMGFRNNMTTDIPTGDEPETIYMVTSGKHYNDGCCFDYGNAEVGLWPNTTNNLTYAKGLMECIYWGEGFGVDGPHVMADLEMGVYDGARTTGVNKSYTAINATFVTAMVKGDSNNHWSIKWGDAQSGPLHTAFDGPRPQPPLYNPMKKPGGLILGLGGDTSNTGVGTFYEGAITMGYSTNAADDEVQASVVAARYGQGKLP